MKRKRGQLDTITGPPGDVEWTTTVTARLPNCPGVLTGWEMLASPTRWPEWRSPSEMRSADVVTTLVPPAREPLQAGDEYVVKVSRYMCIRCRVLESSASSVREPNAEMVFDAVGLAMGGLVKARFRFTVFTGDDGSVMARADEKVDSLSFLSPNRETLGNEHEHTFRDLNASFQPARS